MGRWHLYCLAVLSALVLAEAQSSTYRGVSCGDYKVGNKQTKDGVFTIYIQTDVAFQAYCAGMGTSKPQMYLQLPAGGKTNIANYYRIQGRKTSCAPTSPVKQWGQYGQSAYTQIPVTASNKVVALGSSSVNVTYLDYVTSVSPLKVSTSGKFIKYGTAGDMFYAKYSTTCLRGTFSIDLRGTPLAVDQSTTWKWAGTMLDAGTQLNTPQLTGSPTTTGTFGASQYITGKCGGFPGTCWPVVNNGKTYGLRFRLYTACQPVDGSLHPCYNGATCIAVDSAKFRCQCASGWTGTTCTQPQADNMVSGVASAARDDSKSRVSCPAGSAMKQCSCDIRYCDGAYANTLNSVCTAAASNRKIKTKATATCASWNPAYYHLVVQRVPGSGYASQNPGFTCSGSDLVGCSSYSPWMGNGVYGKGVAKGSTCNRKCTELTNKNKACSITATCVSPLCGCKNGGTCNLFTGSCTCPAGYVGISCETFDYCRYQLEQTRKAPCQNGGVCAAVPNTVISTSGGDGTGRDCIFPFGWQGKQYTNCINSNTVGPPFACGVKMDGHDDYVDLGAYHPGWKATYEVWFRPDIIQQWRETIIGNMDACSDNGITLSNGFLGFAYKPTDNSCTRQFISKTRMTTGQWHHAALTYDGSSMRLYANGTLLTTQQVKAKYQPSAKAMYIGSEVWCNAKCNNFEGVVKMARVYGDVIGTSLLTSNIQNTKPFDIQSAVTKNSLLAYHEFGNDVIAPSGCHGVEHGGKDWIISKDKTVVTGIHCNVRDFIIKPGVQAIVKWFVPFANNTASKNTGGLYGKFQVFAKNIYVYGSLSAWGAGYPGGPSPPNTRQSGQQGYSTAGLGAQNTGRKIGGGGSGLGDKSRAYGKAGGGGGYGTAGSNGKDKKGSQSGVGQGGQVYGDALLKTFELGSGGGSGGNDNYLGDNPKGGYGGRGGGAIRLDATEKLIISGSVNAQGQPGQGDAQANCNACPTRGGGKTQCSGSCGGSQTTACWDWSGAGGGGSGGSIYLRGETLSIGHWLVNANGGRGGYGPRNCGGNGGVGRIRIDSAFLAGIAAPTPTLVSHNESFPNLALDAQKNLAQKPYVYRGCFVDAANRLFPYKANGAATSPDGLNMKPSTCIALCRAKGYAYAGLQYKYECYCSTSLNTFPRATDWDCNSQCAGDSAQRCGGSWRLSVYGPMPTDHASVGNGAMQVCEPWCRVGWLAKTSTAAGRPLFGLCQGLQAITSFNIKCDCPAGKIGPACENDCPANKWGKACKSTCNCKNGGVCDAVTGKCTCAAGWRGTTCTNQCATGKFGPNCASSCTCNLYCTPSSSCDSNHSTSFEAESGTLGSARPAILTSDKSASGGKVLVVTASNQWSAASALVIASYNFNVTIAQQYRMWLRVLSPRTNTDSLYYSLDDGTRRVCWVGQDLKYTWRRCSTNFNLKVGLHKLSLFNREKGLGVDKVFVGTDHAPSTCNSVTGTCSCNPGYLGPTCSNVCAKGKFGVNCASNCACKNDAICSPLDGTCTCLAGWAGGICDQKCGAGLLANRFGVNCQSVCLCQNGATCDAATGACSCAPGYKGLTCDLPCSAGTYGPHCTMTCNCKNGGICEPKVGTCQCPAGYRGSLCSQACLPYTYGVNCAQKCNLCPAGTTKGCDVITGACACQPGVRGIYCNQTCPANKWGQGCSATCCCPTARATCAATDGTCSCKNGWQGKCCNTACTANRWGPNCGTTCLCKNGGTCNRFNGGCSCPAGYSGSDCGSPCNTLTPSGKYGLRCRSTVACVLANTASYDSVTGACTCKSGFGGLTCQPCPTGTHGVGCLGNCGCKNGGQCHSVHGTCDCPTGYHGSVCSATCGAGTYGYGCALSCGCKNGAACDPKTGACTCTAGYSGPACDTTCMPGTYGTNCALSCGTCIFGSCNAVNGLCQCMDGYTGANCSKPCVVGFWGRDCTQFCNCPVGSQCNNTNGACICTAPGKSGANCDQACPGGKYGVGCAAHCPACSTNYSLGGCDGASGKCLCKPGYTGPLCQQSCPQGTWGSNCSQSCLCTNGQCHPDLGFCVCSAGFMGKACQTPCPTGTYGQACAQSCLCSPPRGTCNNVDGSCTCLAGYIGGFCGNTCPSDHWGPQCANLCTGCDARYGTCDHVTGVCHCLPGKTGTGCSQTCKNGTWGVNCNETCLCVHGTCNPVDGTCTCFDGYTGSNCRNDCPTSFFGKGCLQQCTCKNNATCAHLTGFCDCTPGWLGSSCTIPCGANNFGHNCYQTCSCKNGAVCDRVTGFCNCAPGWDGLTCETPCPAGTWGPHCSAACPYCQYQSAGTCNSTTGKCQCDPGYQQPSCNATCAAGTFGANCAGLCSCSGAGSICVPQNGTCLCGGSHTFCKFGTCDQAGACACTSGFIGPDCTKPCVQGMYGANCIQKCACASTATCSNVNGACSCPGAVVLANLPMNCSGQGTCGNFGLCTCNAGFTGPACDQTCQPGKWGAGCSQTCRTCSLNKVCSPYDGTCVDHCSSMSTDLCKNGGMCLATGGCNCTTTGYGGAHCDVGVLNLKVQNLFLYKSGTGANADVTWMAPANLANFSAFSPTYKLTLTDITDVSDPTTQSWTEKTATAAFNLPTTPNRYYRFGIAVLTEAGGGVPVEVKFTANLLCLPGDGSVNCKFTTCGTCAASQYCDSYNNECRVRCNKIVDSCIYGTCNENNGLCACSKDYGGINCVTFIGGGTSAQTSSSSGISTGALAGIIIGAVALIALAVVIVAVLLRNQSGKGPAAGDAIDVGGQVQYDASGDSVGFSNPVYAASPNQPVKDNPLYESQEILEK